ncbi:MAG: hypothetical protein H6Q23_134, partial [Bacteroidetes bacterium]|nr:hypothetical protein [Bacteroidota bacterium]
MQIAGTGNLTVKLHHFFIEEVYSYKSSVISGRVNFFS